MSKIWRCRFLWHVESVRSVVESLSNSFLWQVACCMAWEFSFLAVRRWINVASSEVVSLPSNKHLSHWNNVKLSINKKIIMFMLGWHLRNYNHVRSRHHQIRREHTYHSSRNTSCFQYWDDMGIRQNITVMYMRENCMKYYVGMHIILNVWFPDEPYYVGTSDIFLISYY